MSAAPQGTRRSATVPRRPRAFPRMPDLAVAREITPLAGAMGACGLVSAFFGTTASLFLANAVHAAPFQIGLFFAARGAASIAISLAAGWISDRLPDRRFMIA